MGASSKPLTFTDAAREFAEKSHRQRRQAVADIDFAELAAICDLNYNPKVVHHLIEELKEVDAAASVGTLKSDDIRQALENARRLVHKGKLDKKFTARNFETLQELSELLQDRGGDSEDIYALKYIVDPHERYEEQFAS